MDSKFDQIIQEKANTICVYENTQRSADAVPDFLRRQNIANISAFHNTIPFFEKTPLVELPSLAKRLGIANILVKDESKRFGLNAFKGLGASYAIFRTLCEKFDLDPRIATFKTLQQHSFKQKLAETIFITATDGNHGRGVAWAAALLGCRAKIYMPKGSLPERVRAIAQTGESEVFVTDLSYDDTVRLAASDANINGWTLVQDTSWEGYEKIPTWIIQGYTTLAEEAISQMAEKGIHPTHVFLQAGVGSMAGGVLGCLADAYSKAMPLFSIVEPATAACIYASAKYGNGKTVPVPDSGPTIMAGLNCGETCPIIWPLLRDFAAYYFSCPDYVTAEGMRAYAYPMGNDPAIISGESGAVTLGILLHIMQMTSLAKLRSQMHLNQNSTIFLINTEGDTAPACYTDIVAHKAFPSPHIGSPASCGTSLSG